jgi:organic hydroperoxide reductase OsmC/OhrA
VAVRLEADGAGLLTAGARPAIIGGAPPQFGGEAAWWSPEHLLLAAVNLCLMTTFQAFVSRQALEVRRYQSLVKGILEKTPAGIVFTSIVVDVELETAAERVEDAKRLLESAKHYCIVSHALKTPVDLRIVANAG